MSMFIESPWPATILCIVVQVILGVIFMRTGRAWVVVGMGIVLAMTCAAILLEQTIVTDTEQVEDTLHGVAELLAANDKQAVLASFAPQCPRLAEIRAALDRVTVEAASVGADLEVRITQLSSPPSATAFFTGRIQASERSGTVPYEHFIRKFKVKLERHGHRWLITDVEDASGERRPF